MSREHDAGRIPEELAEWMRRFGGEDAEPRGAESRAEAGIRALRAALDRTGKDREGAYALLAADGLITEAVRELAEVGDPEAEFRELLVAVSATLAEREE